MNRFRCIVNNHPVLLSVKRKRRWWWTQTERRRRENAITVDNVSRLPRQSELLKYFEQIYPW